MRGAYASFSSKVIFLTRSDGLTRYKVRRGQENCRRFSHPIQARRKSQTSVRGTLLCAKSPETKKTYELDWNVLNADPEVSF